MSPLINLAMLHYRLKAFTPYYDKKSKVMKSALIFLFLIACSGLIKLSAQAPAMFNYQAVVRDNSGDPLINEPVEIHIDILLGNHDGEVVFSETHTTETNDYGLVNLRIGSLEPLDAVSWGTGEHFIRLYVNGNEMGITQLLSVPFALHALQSADSFSGDYEDLDNLPDLSNFVILENPSAGDMLVFLQDQWQPIPAGQEGQVLMVKDGLPQWQDVDTETGTTVTDIDGNIYNTVVIGQQEWMAENLKTTRYNDGVDISYPGNNNSAWESNTNGAYAWYDNDIANKDIYGALYNFYAVDQASNGGRNICPEGWRVPEVSDWLELTDYLISNYSHITQNNVANFLKSCRQVGSPQGDDCNTGTHPRWDSDGTHYGTDEFGFGALPGGRRYIYGNYQMKGQYGHWWTQSASGDFMGYFRAMISYDGGVFPSQFFKGTGMAVRCIKE